MVKEVHTKKKPIAFLSMPDEEPNLTFSIKIRLVQMRIFAPFFFLTFTMSKANFP